MRKRPILLLAILSGCASSRPYVDPAGDLGAYARIDVENASRVPLVARLYEDPVSCSAPVTLGEAALQTGEARTVYAKKGEPLTIGAWYHYELGPGYSRECDLNATFVPTAAAYRVTLESDGLAKTCRVAAVEVGHAVPRPVPPDRLVVRRSTRPFNSRRGPWCPPLEVPNEPTHSGRLPNERAFAFSQRMPKLMSWIEPG